MKVTLLIISLILSFVIIFTMWLIIFLIDEHEIMLKGQFRNSHRIVRGYEYLKYYKKNGWIIIKD